MNTRKALFNCWKIETMKTTILLATLALASAVQAQFLRTNVPTSELTCIIDKHGIEFFNHGDKWMFIKYNEVLTNMAPDNVSITTTQVPIIHETNGVYTITFNRDVTQQIEVHQSNVDRLQPVIRQLNNLSRSEAFAGTNAYHPALTLSVIQLSSETEIARLRGWSFWPSK